MTRRFVALLTLTVVSAGVAADLGNSFRRKLLPIQNGKARRGSTVLFTSDEINAYARSEVSKEIPEGVRDPRVELGNGSATGYARIDFLLLRRDAKTPWLIRKMIEGERPVKVEAHIRSAGGTATVFLDRVEVSGVGVSGGALDFLIGTFFLHLFPNARINREFALSDRVDRIEVNRAAARVVMRK